MGLTDLPDGTCRGKPRQPAGRPWTAPELTLEMSNVA